jgi:glutathione S-transferase
MLTLYHSLTSPYARKVRSVLLEKRVAFEGVNVAEAARSAAEHNPLGKVPTLLLGDGTVLFDSRVIVETLDAMYPEPRLIPEEPRARAIVRHWEALGDGICDVLIPIVLDSRRPPEQRDAAYTHKLENKVRACFDYVEPLVAGRDDVGETFSLADVALVCAFGYVQLRRPELLDGRDAILGYVSRQLRRPSLKETAPPNLPIR